MIDFTYKSYFQHIQLLKDYNYTISPYTYDAKAKKLAILRHDVDFSLESAVELAEREAAFGEDVRSTYFVLLRTDFYNVFSYESQRMIRRIQELGHEIGLHFDETFYDHNGDLDLIREAVLTEKKILEQACLSPVRTVSMHRPSREILNANLYFEGMINSYSEEYFKAWKYVSDSRMNWREDLAEVIEKGNYDRLHILTHPFWYADKLESTKEKLQNFISGAKVCRYNSLYSNFKNLDEFIKKDS